MNNIGSVHMNCYEFMRGYEAKIAQNTNNLLKRRLLMHHDGVLPQIIAVES